MIPAFIALVAFVAFSNEKIANTTSRNLIERLKVGTELSLGELISPTRDLVQAAAALGNINPQFFKDDKSWDYLLSSLKQQESSLSAYAGNSDGSFRQVRRVYPGTKLQDKVITPEMQFGLRWLSRERARDAYTFIDAEGKRIGSSSAAVQFDPRTRPWYEDASSKKGLILTDPYIFSSTGLPGITIAAPFYNKGDIAGVVGTDISLEKISKFLSAQRISEHSISVIYDSAGTVIASSVLEDTFKKTANGVDLNKVSTLSSDLPAFAIATQTSNPESLKIFNHPNTGREYVAVFSPVLEDLGKGWMLLSISPMEDFKGEFTRNNQIIFAFGLILIVVQIFLIYVFARKISTPLESLTKSIQDLMSFRNTEIKPVQTNIYELSLLSSAVKKLATTITAFSSYIPRDLVNKLLSTGEPIEVGGQSRYLTILFTDLKDFSTLSETTPARELLIRVSSYFELMTHAIKEENGTVDKFIGDAVMAFWGAPLLDEHHAYHACVAAIKAQRRMEKINAKLTAEGKPPLYVRIGIHSDAVLVGNIGSLERLSYTVMGDGVNIASRLEGVNKEYGIQVCASHSVYKEAGERLWMRPVDQITVKGRKGELIIYEVIGTRDGDIETQPSEMQIQVCKLSEKAFELYLAKDYVGAEKSYREILKLCPDPVADVMIQKCRGALHSS